MNVYTPDLFDPTGCLISEKFDGVCAEWDGLQFHSRAGHVIHAPDWFRSSLPSVPLSGELWAGRGRFEHTLSIVSSHDAGVRWQDICFAIWSVSGTARAAGFDETISTGPFAFHVERWTCQSQEHLKSIYQQLVNQGAEGLVIRDDKGIDWKWKPIRDDDGIVIEHKPGRGRNAFRCGSLRVRDREGRVFCVSIPYDEDHDHPPAINSLVTFRFQGRTAKGIPRFAQFLNPRYENTFV